MQYKTKRILAFLAVGAYQFFTGLENAWRYLNFVGITEEYVLGVMISGFSACGAIFGILGGRLADAYPNRTKGIVVFANCAMILGNLLYLLGGSATNLILGRVICGMSSCAGAALLGELCRTTSVQERTIVLSVCNGLRQVGLLMGPGFQLLLEMFYFDFLNGLFTVRPFNAPGLFMAVLWVLYSIFILVGYQNLEVEHKYEKLRKDFKNQDMVGHSIEVSSYQEHASQLEAQTRTIYRWYFLEEATQKEESLNGGITWKTYIDEFFHDDTVVLFGVTMALFFGQVGIETTIPPLLTILFDYSSYETSLVYMIGGSMSITAYLLVGLTTRWTTDTFLLLFGLIVHLMGFIWLLIWLPQIHPGESKLLPVLVLGILFLYIGFPVAVVGATSLLTKCISFRVQGIAQGLRKLSTFVGLTLGPLWASASLRKPTLQISVQLLLLSTVATLFCFSFKKIRAEEKRALVEFN